MTAGQAQDGEHVAAGSGVDPRLDVELDTIPARRVEVAVGTIVEDRALQAEHAIALGDAVAGDVGDLCRESDAGLPARREGAVKACVESGGLSRIGGDYFAQRCRFDPKILSRQPPVGFAEGGPEGKAGVEDRVALSEMVDLSRQAQTFGLAEQVAMDPEALDSEAELRLVAHAEADGALQPVGQLDVDRQFAVRVEFGGGLDPHRVERAQRRQLAAQRLDLGGGVGFALLERHAALQPDRVDLFRAGETHLAHPGERSGFGDERHLGFARGVVDDDLTILDRGQRVPLFAQFLQQLVLRRDDGRGVGGIARREPDSCRVDAGKGLRRAGGTNGNRSDAVARTGVDGDVDRRGLRVGARFERLQGGGIGNRLPVDRGVQGGVVESARPQRGAESRGDGLRSLQNAQGVARQRLLLLEVLGQFLEFAGHRLVARNSEDDVPRAGVGGARQQARHTAQRQRDEAAYAHPAQELAS